MSNRFQKNLTNLLSYQNYRSVVVQILHKVIFPFATPNGGNSFCEICFAKKLFTKSFVKFDEKKIIRSTQSTFRFPARPNLLGFWPVPETEQRLEASDKMRNEQIMCYKENKKSTLDKRFTFFSNLKPLDLKKFIPS